MLEEERRLFIETNFGIMTIAEMADALEKSETTIYKYISNYNIRPKIKKVDIYYSIWKSNDMEMKQRALIRIFKRLGINFGNYKEYNNYINKFKPFRMKEI